MKNIKLCILCMIILMTFTACGGSSKETKQKELAQEEISNKENQADKEGILEEKEEKKESQETDEAIENETFHIVISAPCSEEDIYWKRQLTIMQSKFEEQSCTVQIVYANNDSKKQAEDIASLSENVNALILVAQDSYALSEALEIVEEKDIPVFCYDKLVMNTDAIKYYVTFSTREMGNMIGEEIIKQKELDKAKDNNQVYTIEFLMGDPEEMSDLFFFNGILEKLQPYFEEGILNCKSGNMDFLTTAVKNCNSNFAANQLKSILDTYYAENDQVDILCLGKELYMEQITKLLGNIESKEETNQKPYITVCGSNQNTINQIADERIGCTIFADERNLAEECADLVCKYLKKEEFEVKDYHQYDNGVKIIGTITGELKLLDQDNYQLLFDNGYYATETNTLE